MSISSIALPRSGGLFAWDYNSPVFFKVNPGDGFPDNEDVIIGNDGDVVILATTDLRHTAISTNNGITWQVNDAGVSPFPGVVFTRITFTINSGVSSVTAWSYDDPYLVESPISGFPLWDSGLSVGLLVQVQSPGVSDDNERIYTDRLNPFSGDTRRLRLQFRDIDTGVKTNSDIATYSSGSPISSFAASNFAIKSSGRYISFYRASISNAMIPSTNRYLRIRASDDAVTFTTKLDFLTPVTLNWKSVLSDQELLVAFSNVDGHVFSSDDNGDNWTQRPAFPDSDGPTNVWRHDGKIYALNDKPILYSSSDNAESWQIEPVGIASGPTVGFQSNAIIQTSFNNIQERLDFFNNLANARFGRRI